MKEKEFTIRSMTTEDLTAAMEIKNAEGWNQTLSDWELLLHGQPGMCLVAVYLDEVVATVTAIGYDNQLAWIGMMLVRKEYRGKGLAKLLMDRILNVLNGYPCIKLDATPAGLPVYAQLGFIPEYSLYKMVKSPASQNKPTKSTSNIIQVITAEHHRDLMAFDREIFGVDRQAVLTYLFDHAVSSSVLVKENHKIEGYLTGRPGTNYYQLGPLAATSTEAAISLLAAALPELSDRPVVVDLLHDKEQLRTWLQSQGFVQQREFIRMYYRNNPNPGIPERQFLISGPELG